MAAYVSSAGQHHQCGPVTIQVCAARVDVCLAGLGQHILSFDMLISSMGTAGPAQAHTTGCVGCIAAGDHYQRLTANPSSSMFTDTICEVKHNRCAQVERSPASSSLLMYSIFTQAFAMLDSSQVSDHACHWCIVYKRMPDHSHAQQAAVYYCAAQACTHSRTDLDTQVPLHHIWCMFVQHSQASSVDAKRPCPVKAQLLCALWNALEQICASLEEECMRGAVQSSPWTYQGLNHQAGLTHGTPSPVFHESQSALLSSPDPEDMMHQC